MKPGSGIAPVTKMLCRGIPVALANDGGASNDLLDMFEEMRCASLLQKIAVEDPAVILRLTYFAWPSTEEEIMDLAQEWRSNLYRRSLESELYPKDSESEGGFQKGINV